MPKIKTHYLRDNEVGSACGEQSEKLYNDIRMVNCADCLINIPHKNIGYFKEVNKHHKVDWTAEKYHENHYQKELRDWLIKNKLTKIIETGIFWGVSTDRILQALDTVGEGFLYSIDPDPRIDIVKHPRWYPYLEESQIALPKINGNHNIDVFLHDSDHGYDCQTFEYEYALNHLVRLNGYILTDDPWWGDPPHHAWEKFIVRNANYVKPIEKIGHACFGVQVIKLP